jgi:hypothetical protein
VDGGRTFELNPVINYCEPSNTIHIDNHAFWINPDDNRHLIIGNDGGIAISQDRGDTWRFVRNLPLSQFYHIRVDNDDPYHIYGGLQDNGSWRGPSEIRETAGIRNFHWREVGFGDGFDTLPDPENSRQGYVMSQGGNLSSWNLDTGEQRLIRPMPPSPDIELRFNWNAAIAQDPFDPATIYYGSQFVHKSTDRGLSWTVISDDLTSNNPEWQTYKESGGLTYDVTAAENFTTIVSIAPSPLEAGTIWVGTDDGRIHITRDGGRNWSRIDQRARGVPAGTWVPMIAPSPHDPGTAFVVFDNHRRSDMNPYVYRVSGHGRDWDSLITDEISGYALSILQDHADPELLFLGTEFGLFFSSNGGDDWTRFTAGVPTVSVMDMAIQERENDLVLGTHGRSVYVLDDYSALRGLDPAAFSQRLKILSVTPGQQYDASPSPSTRFTGSGEFRAQNEPYGVMVTFMASGDDLPHPDEAAERKRRIEQRTLAPAKSKEAGDEKENGKTRISMTVRDASGEVVRHKKYPVTQGINRIVWGTERNGVRPMPGNEPAPSEDFLPGASWVPPGEYELTLSLASADGEPRETTRRVQVLADPRSGFSLQAREENYQAHLQLLELQEAAVASVERIVHSREDVNTVKEIITKMQLPGEEIDDRLNTLGEHAARIEKDLNSLESRFRTPPRTKGIPYDDDKVISQIGRAIAYVSSTYDAPSSTALLQIELARNALAEAVAELDRFMANDLAQFSRAVSDAGIGLFSRAGQAPGGNPKP